jgi:hypothetical protein
MMRLSAADTRPLAGVLRGATAALANACAWAEACAAATAADAGEEEAEEGACIARDGEAVTPLWLFDAGGVWVRCGEGVTSSSQVNISVSKCSDYQSCESKSKAASRCAAAVCCVGASKKGTSTSRMGVAP